MLSVIGSKNPIKVNAYSDVNADVTQNYKNYDNKVKLRKYFDSNLLKKQKLNSKNLDILSR
jgi:hypothetical protein